MFRPVFFLICISAVASVIPFPLLCPWCVGRQVHVAHRCPGIGLLRLRFTRPGRFGAEARSAASSRPSRDAGSRCLRSGHGVRRPRPSCRGPLSLVPCVSPGSGAAGPLRVWRAVRGRGCSGFGGQGRVAGAPWVRGRTRWSLRRSWAPAGRRAGRGCLSEDPPADSGVLSRSPGFSSEKPPAVPWPSSTRGAPAERAWRWQPRAARE